MPSRLLQVCQRPHGNSYTWALDVPCQLFQIPGGNRYPALSVTCFTFPMLEKLFML